MFSCWVTSYSLGPHGLPHPRLLRPPLSLGVWSNSCPLNRWCHLTISSSVVPFSSWHLSFRASGSFSMSWHFTTSGQSIRASALAAILPINIQGWFPLGLTGWFDILDVQGTFRSLLQHHNLKVSILRRKHSFPGASVLKNLSAIQATQACSWVRKIPWRWNWQSTPVFLPGKSHGQGSLASYNPWGSKRVGHNWAIKQQRLYANGHTQKISALIDTGVSAEVTKNGKTIGLSNSIFLLLFNEQILLMK